MILQESALLNGIPLTRENIPRILARRRAAPALPVTATDQAGTTVLAQGRFLIDRKLSPTEKEKVFVVESDKKICWIAGLRIDDRFKITDKTKQVMRLTFNAQVLK